MEDFFRFQSCGSFFVNYCISLFMFLLYETFKANIESKKITQSSFNSIEILSFSSFNFILLHQWILLSVALMNQMTFW